jgi:AAA+ superfamily predicted ATPase
MNTSSLESPIVKGLGSVSEQEIAPFTSYQEVLAEAERLFQARRHWHRDFERDPDDEVVTRREAKYRALRAQWLIRTEASALPLCRHCVRLGLSGLEHELLWGTLSRDTAIGRRGPSDNKTRELLLHVSVDRNERLAAITFLGPESRLVKNQLLLLAGDVDDPLEVDVFPEASLVEQLLEGRSRPDAYWNLEHEHELYDALRKFYRLLDEGADEFIRSYSGKAGRASKRRERPLRHEWSRFTETLRRHPDWSWNRPEVQSLPDGSIRILMALAAKALDILPESYAIFTGLGLISTTLGDVYSDSVSFELLKPTSPLLRDQWIRPVADNSEHFTGDDREIAKTRFELDERAFEILSLERVKKKRLDIDGVTLREPMITLDRLALSPKVEQSLRLTVTQARAERRLLQEWGLAERLQYGLHPVLLFYGPPGTGKTATAEALAHELDRPLIVADYSKLQNCFVGVTEKNIVQVFREANRRKAVLFWDEADAMLFDRDDAHRNWEVRHVNVILQQIERFEGVCILATNRRHSLDKALARRISMQVEFKRPQTAAERLRIWNAMLPPKLPLDSSVDLGVIAQEDLSGGEIKQVLLNAARFAAARKEAHPRLTHADFEEAVRWEAQAREEKREPVGFCRASLR